MSFATWVADASFLMRREQALLELRKRRGQGRSSGLLRTHLSRVSRWGRVWAIFPHAALLVLSLINPDAEPRAGLRTILVLTLVMTHVVPYGERMLRANEFERLHIPSYPGLLLFRWLLILPQHLVIGACWAGILWTFRPSGFALAAAGLAPLYLTTQKLWSLGRLDLRSLREVSVLGSVVSMGLMPLPALALLLSGSLHGEIEFLGLSNGVWACVLLGWLVFATPWMLRDLLRHAAVGRPVGVKGGEDGVSAASRIECTEEEVAFPTEHRGRRSLWGSSGFQSLRRLRVYRKLGPVFVFACLPSLLWFLASPICAVGSVYESSGTTVWVLTLIAILTIVPWFAMETDATVFGYGVDLSEIERHNLLGRLLGLALMLGAAGVAMSCGGSATSASLGPFWVLLGWGAVRVGWRGIFLGLSGRVGLCLALALVLGFVLSVTSSASLSRWMCVAAGVLGAAGAVRVWLVPEAAWRRMLRAELE